MTEILQKRTVDN